MIHWLGFSEFKSGTLHSSRFIVSVRLILICFCFVGSRLNTWGVSWQKVKRFFGVFLGQFPLQIPYVKFPNKRDGFYLIFYSSQRLRYRKVYFQFLHDRRNGEEEWWRRCEWQWWNQIREKRTVQLVYYLRTRRTVFREWEIGRKVIVIEKFTFRL